MNKSELRAARPNDPEAQGITALRLTEAARTTTANLFHRTPLPEAQSWGRMKGITRARPRVTRRMDSLRVAKTRPSSGRSPIRRLLQEYYLLCTIELLQGYYHSMVRQSFNGGAVPNIEGRLTTTCVAATGCRMSGRSELENLRVLTSQRLAMVQIRLIFRGLPAHATTSHIGPIFEDVRYSLWKLARIHLPAQVHNFLTLNPEPENHECRTSANPRTSTCATCNPAAARACSSAPGPTTPRC